MVMVCTKSHGNLEYVRYFHLPLSIFQDDSVSLLGMGWGGIAKHGSVLPHPSQSYAWQLAWLCN